MTERVSVDAVRVPGVRLLREPTLPILLLALVAMVRRAYVPDICLVSGAAALVAVDSRRWRLRTAPARPAGATLSPGVLVLSAVLAAAMASFPHGPGWLDVPFALVGLVMLRQAWSPGTAPSPDGLSSHARSTPEPPRWWLWPALGIGLALIELFSFLHQSAPMVDNPQHPTLSSVVEPHLASWPVRGVVLWTWLLGCWWLVRRVRAWSPA